LADRNVILVIFMLPPHGLGLYEIKKMDQERGCKLEEI